MNDRFDHPLDLRDTDCGLDLFAEEVSSAEQLQLCCEGCLGSFSTLMSVTGCASCYSTASSYSCDCS